MDERQARFDGWSGDEIATLRQLYPVSTGRVLRRLLSNRTPLAIRMKANSLGLRRAHNYSYVVPTPALAYIAGVFDGEGCVMIARGNPRVGGISPTYSLIATIVNTDPRVMVFLQSYFGGHVTAKPRRSLNRRDSYVWQVCSRYAEAFLTSVRPFAIIKSEQVELALEFASRVAHNNCQHTTQELATRESYRLRLKALKRAIYPITPGDEPDDVDEDDALGAGDLL